MSEWLDQQHSLDDISDSIKRASIAAVQLRLYPDIFKQFRISPSSEKKIHENQFRIG